MVPSCDLIVSITQSQAQFLLVYCTVSDTIRLFNPQLGPEPSGCLGLKPSGLVRLISNPDGFGFDSTYSGALVIGLITQNFFIMAGLSQKTNNLVYVDCRDYN